METRQPLETDVAPSGYKMQKHREKLFNVLIRAVGVECVFVAAAGKHPVLIFPVTEKSGDT